MLKHGAIQHGAIQHWAFQYGAIQHGAIQHGAIRNFTYYVQKKEMFQHGAIRDQGLELPFNLVYIAVPERNLELTGIYPGVQKWKTFSL